MNTSRSIVSNNSNLEKEFSGTLNLNQTIELKKTIERYEKDDKPKFNGVLDGRELRILLMGLK